MNGFRWALKQMQNGEKVQRAGWNGKGMFLFLVPGSNFLVNRPPLLGIYPEGTEIKYRPHIDIKSVDGEIVPWVPSQSDMLATDWEAVGKSESVDSLGGMPSYRSHKVVRALQIKTVDFSLGSNPNTHLHFGSGQVMSLCPEQLVRKPIPVAGMYFVRYDDDYFSFSPAASFEEGYTRI
jgi:hypothetical protein